MVSCEMKKLWLALCLIVLGLAPAQAQQIVPSTAVTIPIAGTVAASTKIIAGILGERIYFNALQLIPVATSVVTFTAGTGTNCGTGTSSLTGAMAFNAGQILSSGNGYGALLVAPIGNDVCITITTAAAPGYLAYSQF